MGAPLRRLAGGRGMGHHSSALHGLADARGAAHALGRGRRLDGEHLLLGLLGFLRRRLLGRFFRGRLLRGRLLAARRALRRRRRLLHLLVGGLLLLLLGRRDLGRRLLRGARAGEYASRRRRNKTRASTGSGVAGRFAFGVARFVFLGFGFSSAISSSSGAGVGLSLACAWKASTASCVKDDGKGTEGGFARPPNPRAVSIHCFLGSVASVQVCGHRT